MEKTIFVSLLLFFVVSSCLPVENGQKNISSGIVQDRPICDPPYIRHAYTCCLDTNSNRICDSDEKTAIANSDAATDEIKDARIKSPAQDDSKKGKTLDFENIKRTLALVEVVKDGETYQSGMGFFVGEDGQIIMPLHYIEDFPRSSNKDFNFINITDYNGVHFRDVQLITFNKEYDLALIKINQIYRTTPVTFSSRIVIGQPTYIFGFPYIDDGFTLTKGILSAVRDTEIGEFIQTDAAFNVDSGAPLFNEEGEFIGMMHSKYYPFYSEGLNFAMSRTIISSFLNNSMSMSCPSYALDKFPKKIECPISVEKFNSTISLLGSPELLPSIDEFRSFGAVLRNNGDENLTICFKVIRIKDMVKREEKILSQKIIVSKDPYGKRFTIDAEQGKGEKGFLYYDISAYDCNRQENLFRFHFGSEQVIE